MSESPAATPPSSNTMLSVATPQLQGLYHPQPYPSYQLNQRRYSYPQPYSLSHPQPYQHHHRNMPHRVSPSQPMMAAPSNDAAVAQALEIARESPDGAQDPTISKILESALSNIWGKVQAQPDMYIMSREEFAVFNFFQHRFSGQKTAILARKRYWDNLSA